MSGGLPAIYLDGAVYDCADCGHSSAKHSDNVSLCDLTCSVCRASRNNMETWPDSTEPEIDNTPWFDEDFDER